MAPRGSISRRWHCLILWPGPVRLILSKFSAAKTLSPTPSLPGRNSSGCGFNPDHDHADIRRKTSAQPAAHSRSRRFILTVGVMSLQTTAEHCSELFAKCCGHPPRCIVAAPGRVNLVGEHTDYNHGFVLPMAIERHTVFAGALSSSGALEVAAATFLETLDQHPIDPIEKALLCQKAEHDFARVPCGIMDQFTSILAKADHALLLDCRSRQITCVPMNDPDVTVLIINTNVRRKLADGEYARRRSQCEQAALVLGVPSLRDATAKSLKSAEARMEGLVFRRARHVVTENERTIKAAEAIQHTDWLAAGQLMYASHDSLRDDYQVSCRELDAIVEICKTIGVVGGILGCRMTGAGFGGCAVSLVKTEAVKNITKKIDETFEKA